MTDRGTKVGYTTLASGAKRMVYKKDGRLVYYSKTKDGKERTMKLSGNKTAMKNMQRYSKAAAKVKKEKASNPKKAAPKRKSAAKKASKPKKAAPKRKSASKKAAPKRKSAAKKPMSEAERKRRRSLAAKKAAHTRLQNRRVALSRRGETNAQSAVNRYKQFALNKMTDRQVRFDLTHKKRKPRPVSSVLDARYALWYDNPRRYDLVGIDTPRTRKTGSTTVKYGRKKEPIRINRQLAGPFKK